MARTGRRVLGWCRFADRTIERISREASAIGSDVALLCERILADRPHPEQGIELAWAAAVSDMRAPPRWFAWIK